MNQSRISIVVFSQALIIGLGASLAGASNTEGLSVADWVIATIDDTREVGYNVSVAVDHETGHTYISYYEGIDGDLWLARTGAPVGNCGPNNTWECQVLDTAGVVGKYSSIAVGGPGSVAKLFISYHDVTNGSLKVVEGSVERSNGTLSFASFVVDDGDPGAGYFMGSKTSMTLDDSGTPHIGYQAIGPVTQAVKYASPVAPGAGSCGPANGWECAVAEGAVEIGEFVDIELDSGGVPWIAMYGVFGPDAYPVIARWVGSAGNCNNGNEEWQCDAVEHQGYETGEYLSFEIDATGVSQLAYRNATMESLEWARYVGFGGNCGAGGDSWQCVEIDDIGPGAIPSGIALEHDGDGHPIIAYQDVFAGVANLELARPFDAAPWAGAANCGTAGEPWYCEILHPGDASHQEAYGGLSMATNAAGDAAVAYRELFYPTTGPAEGRLMVALETGHLFSDGFESGGTSLWSSTVP